MFKPILFLVVEWATFTRAKLVLEARCSPGKGTYFAIEPTVEVETRPLQRDMVLVLYERRSGMVSGMSQHSFDLPKLGQAFTSGFVLYTNSSEACLSKVARYDDSSLARKHTGLGMASYIIPMNYRYIRVSSN